MFEACHPYNTNATFPVILPRPTDHLSSNVCSHSTQQSRAISTLFSASGTFVEFGGNDGFHESNTRHLECRASSLNRCDVHGVRAASIVLVPYLCDPRYVRLMLL